MVDMMDQRRRWLEIQQQGQIMITRKYLDVRIRIA